MAPDNLLELNNFMSTQTSDVVLIGGGIVGLFCAYYLRKAGREVTVIDKGPSQSAASFGNCGLISPSHVLPLNDFQLILKATSWLLKPDSPFYIKPRANFEMAKWFLNFVWNARPQTVKHLAQGRHNILQSSRKLFDELFAEHELPCDWNDTGVFFLFKEEKTFNQYQKTNELLTTLYGVEAVPYVGQALREVEPIVHPDVYGGFLYENDASLKPDALVSELVALLTRQGVRFIDGKEVTGYLTESDRVTAVRLDSGETVEGKAFVLAGGAMSSKAQSQLHTKIPIQPGKGYSITVESDGKKPTRPCMFDEVRVVATPWKSSYRLGGTMEFAGYNQALNPVRLGALERAANQYLTGPIEVGDEPLQWTGWRPMSPDELPMIGFLPRYQNALIASGHGMLGLSMGPSTGLLIAELLTEKTPHIDPEYYSIQRFQ